MKIRMLTTMAGPNLKRAYHPDEVIDVADAYARTLIDAGAAERVAPGDLVAAVTPTGEAASYPVAVEHHAAAARTADAPPAAEATVLDQLAKKGVARK